MPSCKRRTERTSIPELNLHDLVADLETLGCELDVDGGRGRVELILHPTAQQIGLANARITDDNYLVPVGNNDDEE